ncbi:MAG TPA: MgtC/SapB family protein [Terriglobales bacterium]
MRHTASPLAVIKSSQIDSVETFSHIYEVLRSEMTPILGSSIAKLLVAALLGAAIGLERELKHRPAGLRTNLFICMGAAMYTLLSDQLAVLHIGDHTRIAAQIIPGIGFIGAGTIIHARGDLVTGITSAATLFVVASIGMAVGGGLYLTAVFATCFILLCLSLLARVEDDLGLKLAVYAYEVTGRAADEISLEVNQILEKIHSVMLNVEVAPTRQHVRVQFEVEGTYREQSAVLGYLKQSPVLESVVSLGPVLPE